MKKACLLLLGLFVAGLAAMAVPREHEQKIKPTIVHENSFLTSADIDMVNAVEVVTAELEANYDLTTQQAILEPEANMLVQRWRYRCGNDMLTNIHAKPFELALLYRRPHTGNYFYRC